MLSKLYTSEGIMLTITIEEKFFLVCFSAFYADLLYRAL